MQQCHSDRLGHLPLFPDRIPAFREKPEQNLSGARATHRKVQGAWQSPEDEHGGDTAPGDPACTAPSHLPLTLQGTLSCFEQQLQEALHCPQALSSG